MRSRIGKFSFVTAVREPAGTGKLWLQFAQLEYVLARHGPTDPSFRCGSSTVKAYGFGFTRVLSNESQFDLMG